MTRQMSKVVVFYDGTYEVIDIGESEHATQHFYGCAAVDGEWKDCQSYYCVKGREKYYLRKLAEGIIEEKNKQIRKLEEEKYILIDKFENLLKE